MESKLKKRGGGVQGGAVLGPRRNAEAVLDPRNSTYSGTSALSFPGIPGQVLSLKILPFCIHCHYTKLKLKISSFKVFIFFLTPNC